MRERNYLFEGRSSFDYTTAYPGMALKEIESMREDEILSRSTDDILEQLKRKYSFDFPVLHREDEYFDEEDATREVSNRYDYWGDSSGTRTIKQKIAVFHLPFSGDAGMFAIQPSSRSIPGPTAEIRGSELLIRMIVDGKQGDQIKSEYQNTVQSINTHIQQLTRDLGNIYAHIEPPCRAKIEERKATILRNRNTLSAIGIPMKRRSDAPTTYRAPDIQRKVTPVRPPATGTRKPFAPEPALDEAEYTHILNIMDNMTKVMERSPHAFAKMGEEDIRQHFLVQLNAQYEGQATGETFNYQGKTDILIRSEGKNIFIAECKIWRGEKVFLETVDQILSYLSWRDTKTAVVIFNRNKDMSAVLATIKSAMGKHEHKKRGPKVESETRFRYVIGNPSDHDREVVMTVMVYDIPAPED